MNNSIQRARALYEAGDLPHPDQVPCICGAARADHGGATASGKCAATGCRAYRADADIRLAAVAALADGRTLRDDLRAYDQWERARLPRKAKGTISVRPSDIGGCDREVWYRELGHEIEGYVPAPTSKGQATAGAIIHEEIMRRRSALYPHRMLGDRKGFELYLPGNERPSKYDEYDPITGVLWSLKTAGDWRWEKVGQNGPEEYVWDQDQAYAFALNLKYPELPVRKIVVQYVHRENTDKAEAFERPYDEARAQAVLAQMQALAMQLELRIEPERQRSGPSTDPLCGFCPARNHCWNIEAAAEAGRSPESYTVLGLDPDDAIVNELGLALVDAREKKNAAKKVEDELKALLDGVELKAYADIEGVPGNWNSSTDYASYQAAVERMWNLPDALRPAEPPQPQVKKSRNKPTWKLLRKATRLAREKAAREAAVALEAPEAPQEPLRVSSERDTPRELTAAS